MLIYNQRNVLVKRGGVHKQCKTEQRIMGRGPNLTIEKSKRNYCRKIDRNENNKLGQGGSGIGQNETCSIGIIRGKREYGIERGLSPQQNGERSPLQTEALK